MAEFERKTSNGKIALIGALIFVVYNLIVFVGFGIFDHNASFWISYGFMIFAMICASFCIVLLKNRKFESRDWLLGYTFYKHSALYVVLELVFSIMFMALSIFDITWKISFVVQIVLFVVYAVFITSCFIAKETIENVDKIHKTKTVFMKGVLVSVEMIIKRAVDSDVKVAFSKLCDEIRYSDYVSCEQLEDLDSKIQIYVDRAEKYVLCNDKAGALECCENLMLLVEERNQKNKLYK